VSPRKPEHKGKVERGVAYLRNNALKGRRFRSLAEENLFLQKEPDWGQVNCVGCPLSEYA
jgi:hypothetical protein